MYISTKTHNITLDLYLFLQNRDVGATVFFHYETSCKCPVGKVQNSNINLLSFMSPESPVPSPVEDTCDGWAVALVPLVLLRNESYSTLDYGYSVLHIYVFKQSQPLTLKKRKYCLCNSISPSYLMEGAGFHTGHCFVKGLWFTVQ